MRLNKTRLKKEDDIEIDWQKMKYYWNTPELDKNFTSRVLGYESNDAFYDAVSCKDYVKDVKVPVLMVTAKNDFCSNMKMGMIPFKDMKENGNFMTVVTPKGGHCDFYVNLQA